jgi:hypothetical protein
VGGINGRDDETSCNPTLRAETVLPRKSIGVYTLTSIWTPLQEAVRQGDHTPAKATMKRGQIRGSAAARLRNERKHGIYGG